MTTWLTLVLDDGAERIEMIAPLDAAGRFDVAACVAAPDAWTATRHVGAEATLPGMLRHDADGGWSLRFSPMANDPDAPLATLLPGDAGLTLGGYLSIREPDGRVRPWQVVSLDEPLVEPGGIEPPTS